MMFLYNSTQENPLKQAQVSFSERKIEDVKLINKDNIATACNDSFIKVWSIPDLNLITVIQSNNNSYKHCICLLNSN
jgi:hypothetical protein